MAADQAHIGFRTDGRIGIDFDLDRQHFPCVRRKAEFVEQTRETHEATVHEPVFAEAQLNFIVLSGEFGADGLQVPRQ